MCDGSSDAVQCSVHLNLVSLSILPRRCTAAHHAHPHVHPHLSRSMSSWCHHDAIMQAAWPIRAAATAAGAAGAAGAAAALLVLVGCQADDIDAVAGFVS
jgi:hypothetical protein